ncbi:MAG: serine/threonine protein kinase [Nannocystaceae bacterium]|nr:serine/threonine protein kinase [Deltaproteobacteria bacterium]MBP7289552.1 serine/threonine protein kinase [Nannocystaceae bacterium]
MLDPCPDEAAVLRYLAGEAGVEALALEAHVDRCTLCRRWFAELARTSLGLPAVAVSDDDAAGPSLGEHLPPGTEVGRYRVLRVLGSGGLGVVYAAADPRLRRTVALKVLRTEVARNDAARLLAEARAMAKLSHPNVCAVLDVGVIDGRWFLAMALLEGGTLAQWLDQSRPRAAILQRFTEAARGLLAVHRVGVIHRDFKPSNVLLDAHGTAQVSDFGLSAELRESTEAHGGTPHYMAPEQRDGGGDARVDQFAFGVALGDALRGPSLPSWLLELVARCTAIDPAARYPDMAAVLATLERRGGSRLRRAARLGAVATVGVAAVIGATVIPRSGSPERADAAEAPPPAAAPIDTEVRARIDRAVARDLAGAEPTIMIEIEAAMAVALSHGDAAGIALSRLARAEALAKFGRLQAAYDEHARAFELATTIPRDDIAVDAAAAAVSLLVDLGRADEADQWLRRAEATLARIDQPDTHSVAGVEVARARVAESAHDLEGARVRLRRAIELLAAAAPRLDGERAVTLSRLAQMEARMGDGASARRHFAESIALASIVSGPQSVEVAETEANLAFLEAEHGEFEAARVRLERARSSMIREFGEAHDDIVALDSNLASLMLRTRAFDDALRLVDATLARAPERRPVTCVLREQRALALMGLTREADAVAPLQSAIDCYDAVLGPGSREAELAGVDLERIRGNGAAPQ